jgi:uncharacterized protein (DUF1778 family)
LRVSPRLKSTIERAAAYSDKTLTDFITEAAAERAEAVLRAQETITLSAEDWEAFQEMILNPPEPNEALKRALAEGARVVIRRD